MHGSLWRGGGVGWGVGGGVPRGDPKGDPILAQTEFCISLTCVSVVASTHTSVLRTSAA